MAGGVQGRQRHKHLFLKRVFKFAGRAYRQAGILTCLCILSFYTHAQSAEGTQLLKFRVKENGIYRIGYNDLKNAGLNPDAINPAFIQLETFPTGMLSQKNEAEMPPFYEVPVTVTGQADGKFDPGDEIIFYGQGSDKYEYRTSKNIFAYENNLYSDVNFYFLRISFDPGNRIAKSSLNTGAHPIVDKYVDFGYYETDQYNDLKSGREWFGEQFDTKTEITIRFNLPGIVPNSNIRFVSNLMTQSYEPASFRISWNNQEIFNKIMDTIPQTTYGSKGSIDADTTTFTAASVGAPTTSDQDIKVNFTKGGGNRSVGYLNYLIFAVDRTIAMYNSTTLFTVPANNNGNSDIQIASFPSDGIVWDVTNPFSPQEMSMSVSGNVGSFASPTDVNRMFVAFSKGDMKTPEFVEKVEDRSLRLESPAQLIIVTHPNFLEQANRLAAHRRSAYGLDVKVVTTSQIYNEFSGGRQDITAIRDYVRYMYLRDPNRLKNLLLFGRRSYDYKDRVFNNSNYVPIYESRNSLDPLLTYSSDDYFGFLEVGEGLWREDVSDDHTLDIGVGRLPVTTAQQAKDVVDKLVAYDNRSEQSLWKQRILFVADDGDWNIHQSQAEELAESFESLYKNVHTSKIYLDAFEQQQLAAGQVSPKAKEALAQELNRGYGIVNYSGHGSERIWMQERILDPDTPLKMRNDNRLPLFITATCEFGRHDDPLLTSTAELLLLRPKVGAIGLVTTARPVNTITNILLNKAFYAAYFDNAITDKDLGSIFRQTKNESSSGVANRNFSLLGDPSMHFDPPKEDAVVTIVQSSDGSDVLKALSKVTIAGEIRLNGNISTGFNGAVEVEVFDRRNELVTLGDENSPFSYRLWDHSLFRGKAKVVQGEFVLEFVVPEGVSDEVQKGKIVLYAYTSDKTRDAKGTLQDLNIGGTDANPASDVSGPSIELFMGDTTFVDGGYANSNTVLVGKLFDKSGINISGYDNGAIEAVLDGSKTFTLNDYYVANEDDFTTGMFSFPISDLEEGQHTITFKAFDTYGNPGTGSVTFIVGKDGALIVEEINAYPNPFSEATPTTIEFRHNRAGEDLEVQVVIYDVLGQLADKREFIVPSSNYKVILFDWSGLSPGGTKMGNGMYLVKVVIRSVLDGAKNDKIARLILTN